jgi:hypothetical protein
VCARVRGVEGVCEVDEIGFFFHCVPFVCACARRFVVGVSFPLTDTIIPPPRQKCKMEYCTKFSGSFCAGCQERVNE